MEQNISNLVTEADDSFWRFPKTTKVGLIRLLLQTLQFISVHHWLLACILEEQVQMSYWTREGRAHVLVNCLPTAVRGDRPPTVTSSRHV